MKNIKKILISVCSVLTLTCSVLGITACKDKDFTADPAENEYEYKYTTNYEGENDPGIEIDGVLDEDVWQNKKWFTNAFYTDINGTMPKLAVTAFNTEYGVYMAAKVQDGNVVYGGSLNQSRNTTFEFYYYADKSDTVLGDRDYSTRHAFMLDCGGELYSTCERMKRAVVVDGVINSGATTGATVEIFVPWSEMRVDVSDGVYPEKLFLLPAYRPILKGNTNSTQMFPVPLNPMHHMKNYYVFDDNGYTDEDPKGTTIGDASNGVAKTANWDTENLADGKVSVSTGVEFNTIYFKDAFTENFMAETTIYPFGGAEGYAGRFGGFFFLATNGNYYAMMLDMREDRFVQAQDGRNTLTKFGLTTLTEAHKTWEQITRITIDNPDASGGITPYEGGVRFKIIKDREKIHYFVNDLYLYSEKLDFVQGNVYAGLFNMNVYAEYEDYSFTALSDEELNAELNYCNIYNIDAKATTVGGYVELNKDYAFAGDDIDIKIVTDSGYKVSKVTHNGEDITQKVSEAAKNGVYRLENINETAEFNVEFEQIENAVTYKGMLVLENNDAQKETVAGNITLVNKTANEQRYETVATTNYGFEVKVEAGEYELFIDNYFGGISTTITESVTEAVEIDLSSKTSVKSSDIRNMNVDFVNVSANTIKGKQGQWFTFNNAADTVYWSARIYNYDLDGFTIETEDGENVQFYFAWQGFFLLKNYDWVELSTVEPTYYNTYKNETKGVLLSPTIVEKLDGSLVELAIVDGELFVTVDGVGKAKFVLSALNEAFTADAKYRVGFATYNGTVAKYPNGGARWEGITAKFGAAAQNDAETIKELCAVEDYSLGTELYSGTSMTKIDTTITYTAETIGAQLFDGVEIAQGTDFVVYATVASGMTAENVGFIVGTLGADNANHLLFQWRRTKNDLYIWRDLGGWQGHDDNVFKSAIGTNGAEIALVYKSGRFYALLNGSQVCTFANSFDNGWGGKLNVSEIIGTTGTIKLGLSIAYGMAQFTEWGYSTDAEVINGYVTDSDIPIEPPVSDETDDWTPVFKGEGAYCKEDETKVEINNGGYLIDGAIVTNWTSDVSNSANWPNGGPGQNNAFEVSTTVAVNATAKQFGFVLTADGGSRLQIMYNTETGRIRVTDGTLHREYNATEGLYKADQSNTFTIKYDGSVWIEFLINGTSAITNGWDGKYIHLRYGFDGENSSQVGDVKAWQSFGFGSTLKVGLAATHGSSTFTDWSFSADNEEPVNPPVETGDWASIFEGDGAYCQENENQVEINNGGYAIKDATVSNWTSDVSNSANWPNGGPGQNTAFEVSTTVAANATAKQFGFVLTTASGSRLQIMYNTETGRIRVTDGTLYREYNAIAGLYKAGESNTLTLKYDGSVYFEFLINGTSAVTNGWDTKYIHLRFGYDGDNSSGVSREKAWRSLGMGNVLKVGLTATNGAATFTEWSFSTGDDM